MQVQLSISSMAHNLRNTHFFFRNLITQYYVRHEHGAAMNMILKWVLSCHPFYTFLAIPSGVFSCYSTLPSNNLLSCQGWCQCNKHPEHKMAYCPIYPSMRMPCRIGAWSHAKVVTRSKLVCGGGL